MQQLSIIHQEKNWIVIDKPAGISVHNEPGKDLISQLENRFHKKPYPVHRLDQETSGLIVVAWNPEIALEIQEALQKDTARKIYSAVVRGQLEGEQKWTWALSDKGEGRKNPQGILKDRKPCETICKTLQANQYFTRIECEILTGRQHQIRKHCALAKHSVVGDTRYGDPKYNQMIAEKYGLRRLFLHAHKLELHLGHKTYEWCANLPKDFNQLLPQ